MNSAFDDLRVWAKKHKIRELAKVKKGLLSKRPRKLGLFYFHVVYYQMVNAFLYLVL